MALIDKLHDNRFTRPVKASVVKSAASRRSSRAMLNAYYNTLSDRAKSRFHADYFELFLTDGNSLDSGEWTVDFCGARLRLPLKQERSRLDWDLAVSAVGHDIEIKSTYAAIIGSSRRPDLFVDIGSNFGQHAALFGAVGIETLCFEPNSDCNPYFEETCALNGLSIRRENVALSDAPGELELVFPPGMTWMGSIDTKVAGQLKSAGATTTRKVPVLTLDDYADKFAGRRALIKIDVEGAEVSVLKGAHRVLSESRPLIIFESNDHSIRLELAETLRKYGYRIAALPWSPEMPAETLAPEQFAASRATNFLANADEA